MRRFLRFFGPALIAATLLGIQTPAPPNGSISGRLLSNNGAPQIGIRVAAIQVPDPALPIADAIVIVSLAQTDSAGRYRLEGVPPGDYFIAAGFIAFPTYYPGVTVQSSARKVSVRAGSTITGVDFVSVDAASMGGSISGKVDLSSFPGGSTLHMSARMSGRALTVQLPLGVDGSFVSPKVQPGAYTLRAAARFNQAGTLAFASAAVAVADGDVTDVMLVAPFQARVTGRVVAEDGNPLPELPGLKVTVRSINRSEEVDVSRDGLFSLNLVEGDNQIGLSRFPQTVSAPSIAYGNRDLGAAPLHFDRTTSGEVRITVKITPLSAVGVTVRGTAANIPTELAAKKLVVHLFSSSGRQPLDASINQVDGSFEFSNVPAGAYTIGLLNPPGTPTLVVGASDLLDAKINLNNNPFFEFPGASAAGFDSGRQTMLRGTIAQEITQIRPPTPARYFRLDVRNENTGLTTRWAVLTNAGPATNPENAKIKVGMNVSVTVYLDRDGSPRAFLVPQTGPNTAAGILLDP